MPAPKIGSSALSRRKTAPFLSPLAGKTEPFSFPRVCMTAPAPKHGRTETVGMRIIMSGTRQDILLKFRRGRVIVDIPK